jgi:hypothetical protein
MANKASPSGILDITSAVNNGQTATITSVISDFELVWVVITGADGCIATVKKNGVTAAVATYHVENGGDPTNSCVITNAQTSFSSTDVLTVAVTGANVLRITLMTRFPDAYADDLTVAIT